RIAIDTAVTPNPPSSTPATSAATRFSATRAITGSGRMYRYTAHAPVYASVVTMLPSTSARGRLRCGSRISSAANVTVFHASYANSALDIDTPTAARKPSPTAVAAG